LEIAAKRFRLFSASFSVESVVYAIVAGVQSITTNGFCIAPQAPSRDVWQRWFWKHTIRDDVDLQRHLDYLHYNPVEHGLAACPHLWEFSSF
jgi:putative transposase